MTPKPRPSVQKGHLEIEGDDRWSHGPLRGWIATDEVFQKLLLLVVVQLQQPAGRRYVFLAECLQLRQFHPLELVPDEDHRFCAVVEMVAVRSTTLPDHAFQARREVDDQCS